MYRFIARPREYNGYISEKETENSLKKIIGYIQHKYAIHNEVNANLKMLSHFIDQEDLIRVGGRLVNSHLSFDSKYAFLLPKCDITRLLLKDIYERNMHYGPQTLLSILRSRFSASSWEEIS